MKLDLPIPVELANLLRATPALEHAYLVGGCVRDALLGIEQKDFDVEVFGLDYAALARALSRWGRTDLVGRSFGVVKLTTGSGCQFDFSVPRRDSKVAPGHKGFEIVFDSTMTPQAAAARRDFTLNALMWNPRSGELLDYFGGAEDLQRRVLRHVGEAFSEDPLRVLRGVQFAGRFDLEAAPETIALSRTMVESYPELAVERVREEWFKWAGKSTRPSAGLRFLAATGWIQHFPEIAALIGCPQDPEWHPEGDVFVHTAHCCDALANLPEWRERDLETRIVLMLAILAHDFGKPSTTCELEKGGRRRIVAHGHEEAGGPLTLQFLERIDAPTAVRERVVPLVTNHLAHLQTTNDRAVRRLANRLAPESIENLGLVITADQFGRPPRPQVLSESVLDLRERARGLKLQAAAPKPILLGRHLIAMGLSPGAAFGRILSAAFEAQLDGEFGTVPDGYGWLASHADNELTPAMREVARKLAAEGGPAGGADEAASSRNANAGAQDPIPS